MGGGEADPEGHAGPAAGAAEAEGRPAAEEAVMPRAFDTEGLVHVQVLRLRGALDFPDAERVAAIIREFIRTGRTKVLFNATAVTALTASAARQLRDVTVKLREYGGDLVVVNPPYFVKRVFELSGTEFQIVETEDQAVRLFGGKT